MKRALRIVGWTAVALAATVTAAFAFQGYDLVAITALLQAMGLC